MSRTQRGNKGDGYEYWSRRYPHYYLDPGKDSKRLTKRYERHQEKDLIWKIKYDLDDSDR